MTGGDRLLLRRSAFVLGGLAMSWLIVFLSLFSAACAAPLQPTPMQPIPVVLPPTAGACAGCRVIYITVYGGLPPGPIKARVAIDGGAERHTGLDGSVPIVVDDTTVIRRIDISAWGLRGVTLRPELPIANQYVELR